MKKKVLISVSIFLAALLLVSCSKPSVVGKWKVDKLNGSEAKEAKFDAVVEFKEDGTYTLQISADGKSESISGTWNLSEDGKVMESFTDSKEEKDEIIELTDAKMVLRSLSLGKDTVMTRMN